ncbi:MAG: protein kinase domain-containing protein [Persicimonas sp.]
MLFGKYCLLERISVGGMAEIFRAKPLDALQSERHLALKRILPHLAEDDEFVKMFIDEAKLTVQLIHPNIVRTYELGRFQASPYILMEFISGNDLLDLQRRLRDRGRAMSVAMACHIAAEIASGLDYVHSKADEHGNPLDIIHRDISPQNVLVTYGGNVKIIDFGIAKATIQQTKTQVGVLKGKFGYMSPEQVRGEDIDHRSDIFTVGILLWEMLTNRRLFRGENKYETIQMLRDPDIGPPSERNPAIPPEVDELVMRALAVDREERYQTGEALTRDLRGLIAAKGAQFESDDLSEWMATQFAEELETERRKRRFFQKIRTPADVRRLARSGEEDGQNLDETTTDMWHADVAPSDEVDVTEFASAHTVVAAGGFDAAKFAAEEEEEAIQLSDEDIIEIDPEDTAAFEEIGDTPVRSGAPAAGFLAPTPGAKVPNPSQVGRRRRRKALAALAVSLLLVVSTAATVFLWTNRSSEASRSPSSGSSDDVGTLVIDVVPSNDLTIEVNGEARAESAPATITDLEPGEHRIDIAHKGGESHRERVDLEPGGFENLTVDLEDD